MHRYVSLLAASLSLTPLTHAEENRIDDQVLIKLSAPLPIAANPYQDRLETTGSQSLDAMLQDMGSTDVKRVFRRPPRGWANERLAENVGLDHWVLVHFQSELTNIDATLNSLRAHEFPPSSPCGRPL